MSGVLQPGQRVNFTLEQSDTEFVRAVQLCAANDLQRDAAAGVVLLGFIDHAHATPAKLADDRVLADL